MFGVDVDGVLVDYEAGLRSVVEDDLGLEPGSLSRADSWDFTNWPIQEKGFFHFHEKLVASGGLATLTPYPDAVETLNALSEDGIYVRIITHRLVMPGYHKQVVSDTVTGLDDFGFLYRDICFAANKATVGADVYVDDAPHNYDAIVATGAPCILYDQVYNRGMLDIEHRAKDWSEVSDIVLELRDKRNHDRGN